MTISFLLAEIPSRKFMFFYVLRNELLRSGTEFTRFYLVRNWTYPKKRGNSVPGNWVYPFFRVNSVPGNWIYPIFRVRLKKHSSSLKYRPPSRTDYKMSPTSQPRHEKNVRREADSNPHSSRIKCMRELTPQPTELSDHIMLEKLRFYQYKSNILSNSVSN